MLQNIGTNTMSTVFDAHTRSHTHTQRPQGFRNLPSRRLTPASRRTGGIKGWLFGWYSFEMVRYVPPCHRSIRVLIYVFHQKSIDLLRLKEESIYSEAATKVAAVIRIKKGKMKKHPYPRPPPPVVPSSLRLERDVKCETLQQSKTITVTIVLDLIDPLCATSTRM